MLVLNRKAGEEIVLPELGISIRLLRVKGKAAAIGIDAPEEHRVLRGELTQLDDCSTARRSMLAASA